MGTIASQITSLTIVYSTDYSDANQRKHQSSASLVFVRGFHRRPVNSPHKWPVTRKMFRLMTSSWVHWLLLLDQICLSPYQGWWLAPDQWETSLQSNAVFNWLDAKLDSALHITANLHTTECKGQFHRANWNWTTALIVDFVDGYMFRNIYFAIRSRGRGMTCLF